MNKKIKLVIGISLLIIAIIFTAFMNLHFEKKHSVPDTKASNKGFAVVELFTSEGCSSCPPADELLRRIQKEDADKPVYILAYHVDYWDHQGWKDAFGNAAYSNRQTKYATWLQLQTLYTPQIVVNGKKEFVGSNKRALEDGISTGLQETSDKYLTIKADSSNGQIRVDYQTNVAPNQSDLVLAFIQKSGSSKVMRGENSGHVLSHVQIVRNLMIQPIKAANGKTSIEVPEDFKGNDWELIAFIQNKMTGEIFAAAKSHE